MRKWEKRSVSLTLKQALWEEQLYWPLSKRCMHPVQLHGLGLANQLVSYKASPVEHKGAARPARPIRGWKSDADKFQPLYCHSLTEWPWHVTFLYAPLLSSIWEQSLPVSPLSRGAASATQVLSIVIKTTTCQGMQIHGSSALFRHSTVSLVSRYMGSVPGIRCNDALQFWNYSCL